MRNMLGTEAEPVRCGDCTRRIHGVDVRIGPDDKPYHVACHERLFPALRHHQDGQGTLRLDREDPRP